MYHAKKFIVYASILTVLLYILAFVPYIRSYVHLPQNRVYLWSEFYSLDFLGYLTIVRHGYRGDKDFPMTHWISPQYQSNPPKTNQMLEYVWLGNIARYINVDPLLIMHASRILFSLLFFFTSYLFITYVFKENVYRYVAYTLLLFAAPISIPWENNMFRIPIDYRIYGDFFGRFIMNKQHHILAFITIILSLISLTRFFDNPKRIVSGLLSACLIAIASWLYIPSACITAGFVGLGFLVLIFRFNKTKSFSYYFLCGSFLLLYILCSISSLPDVTQLTHTFINTEKYSLIFIQVKEFLLLQGVFVFFSLFAVKKLYTSNKSIHLFLIPWIFIHPIATFYFEKLTDRSVVRLYDTITPLMYATIASIGLYECAQFISKKTHLKKNMAIFFLISGILLSGSATWIKIFHLYPCCLYNGIFNDIDRGLWNNLIWLQKKDPSKVVVSGPYIGTYVMSLTDHPVVAQWYMQLGDESGMSYKLYNLFSGKMLDKEVKEFIHRYHISYLVYGEDEQEMNSFIGSFNHYTNIFTPVYQSGKVILYEVNKSVM
jgi:hypothetical protein